MAIYLDHNATTPIAPDVLDAMLIFPPTRVSVVAERHNRARELLPFS